MLTLKIDVIEPYMDDIQRLKNHGVLDTMQKDNDEIVDDVQNWDGKRILQWMLSLENGLFV